MSPHRQTIIQPPSTKTPLNMKAKKSPKNLQINFVNGRLDHLLETKFANARTAANQTTVANPQPSGVFQNQSYDQVDSQIQLLVQQQQAKSQGRDGAVKLGSKFNRHSRMQAQARQ